MIRAVIFVSRHFTAFACLAYVVAWGERVAEALLSTVPLPHLRSSNLTQYFVTYPDHGFAKRALVGTILRPIFQAVDQPQLWAWWTMIVFNLAGFAGVLWLVRRFLPHDETGGLPAILRAAFAVGSVGVVQIAHDYGRFDLLNYGVAVLALWLVLRGRTLAAVMVSAIGILIHEAFAIYAAPLVIALAWSVAPAGHRLAAAAPVAAAWVGAALAILIFGGSESAVGLQIGEGGYVWKRGLIEIGWGLHPGEVAVLAGYWAILLALFAWSYRANAARPDLIALAALAPFALNLFGIDHGRWVSIAFLVVTAALVLQVRALGFRWPALTEGQKRIGCLLALPLGPHGLTGAWTWIF